MEKCLEKKQRWPSLLARLEKPHWGGWKGQQISGDFPPPLQGQNHEGKKRRRIKASSTPECLALARWCRAPGLVLGASPLRPDLAKCSALPRCYLQMCSGYRALRAGLSLHSEPTASLCTSGTAGGARTGSPGLWNCREHGQGRRDRGCVQGQRWRVKLLPGARCCKWAADGISWGCCAGAALGMALLAFLASRVSSLAAGAVGLELPALISPGSLSLVELGSPAWLPQARGSALRELCWCMSPFS